MKLIEYLSSKLNSFFFSWFSDWSAYGPIFSRDFENSNQIIYELVHIKESYG